MNVSDNRYLIIGGAPKAGTTSVYKWLADHPGVCASSLKETRFFIDEDYPLPNAQRFNGHNLEKYDALFRRCSNGIGAIRVDATPDYLYSNTAVQIAELLPHSKIVFVLRDPVERMVSWYKYAIQRGLISNRISFDEYVMSQLGQTVSAATPVHMRALEQCRYDHYLKPFIEAFGERCLVLRFEELKSAPVEFMKKLCSFSGLDGSYYDTYKFKAENVSNDIHSGQIARMYSAVRRAVAYKVYSSPALMNMLKKVNYRIKRLLPMKDSTQLKSIHVSNELRALISSAVK